MIQPEEDFDTWVMILGSVVGSPTDFEMFIPDIERLCNSIRETDELPDVIKDKKIDFLTSVCGMAMRRFLNTSSVTDDSLLVIRRYLEMILKFCAYGIKAKNEIISRWCSDMLSDGNQKLFTFAKTSEMKQELRTKSVEFGCFEAAELALKETDKATMLQLAYTIVVSCLTVGELKNRFWELSQTMIDTLLKICKEAMRDVPIGALRSLLDCSVENALKQEELQPTFVESWLNIFEAGVTSEFFEKQLFAFTGFQNLVLRDKMEGLVCQWFKDPKHLNLLYQVDFHREFLAPITTVLPVLASKNVLTDEFLKELWGMHKVQHETQIAGFYAMFTQIVTTLPVEKINEVTQMCLNPCQVSDAWLKFISDFAGALGNRKDSQESYMMIRDKLFEYALSENPHQISAIAYLGQMLQHYLNPDTFGQVLEKCTQNGFTYLTFRLLLNPTAVCPFSSKEQAVEYVSAAIDWLVTHQEDRDTLYGFIVNVCLKNEVSIPDDKLDVLFSLSKECSFFYTFANKIVENAFCSFDYLEKFIENYNPELITYDFLLLVKAFIFKSNEIKEFRVFKQLPVNKENVLWSLVSKKSPEHVPFCQLLCEFYARNDGVCVTDLQMINTFLGMWLSYYENEKSDKDCLLYLMTCFIQIIEDNIDVSFFGVKRHRYEAENEFFTVNIRGQMHTQNFMAPASMKMGAVKHRAARMFLIPQETFSLVAGSTTCKCMETVKAVAKGQKEVNLYIQKVADDVVVEPERERTAIPSSVLQYTKVMDIATELLKQDHLNAKNLLAFLPTVPRVLFLLEELSKKRNFPYEDFLPRDAPSLFEYDLETLQCRMDDSLRENLERSGGFTYLIESVSEKLANIVIPFLMKSLTEELRLKYAQFALDSMLPLLDALQSPDAKDTFGKVTGFLRELAMTKKSNLVLKESMHPLVEKLLLSTQDHVRKETSSIFANIQITLSVFADLLGKVSQSNESEFFIAALPHVNEYNQVILDYCLSHLTSTSALSILEKMLSLGLVPEDQVTGVTGQLISDYLCVDDKPKDKDCFTLAGKCLSHMQNDVLLAHLQKLHEKKAPYLEWRIDGDASYVSTTGYSGLVNMGATCFLNATLQQFFAIVPLRNKIIEYSGEDPFMVELRNLFAKMQLSKGHSVTVKELVEKWTGWDGEPMNPRIQQDASEFVQMLIDKLETGLDRDFIHKLFGGTTVDTFEGLEEEYHATCSQPYYTFTLPIEGLSEMPAAFEHFQAVDYFTGSEKYHAESLGRKIDAKKVSCLGVLPECLIVQLGRFEYNYQLGTRKKIDSQFNFALTLDVEPYLAPENKGQETKYVLKGVVMHSGTAHFGHYTSYVHSRRGEDKWYLFNDARVTEVTEKDMYEAATGKTPGANGYVLFYERVDFKDIDGDEKPEISLELQKKIQEHNLLNDEYRLYCSSAYFEFMKLIAKSKHTEFIFIALKYYFDSLPFTTHIRKADEVGVPLVEALKGNEDLRKLFTQFLADGPFVSALVYCPHDQVRTNAESMIKELDPESLPVNFLERLWNVLTGVAEYWQYFNEYFDLLAWISSCPKTRSYAEEHTWGSGLCNFVSKDIPQFLETKGSKLRPGYFYEGIGLSGLCRAISVLTPTPEFVDCVLSKEIFAKIISSKSTPVPTLVQLMQAFPDAQRVKTFMTDFVVGYGIHINYFRLLALAFDLLQGDSFEVLNKCHLKVADRSASDFDFICAIGSHLVESPEFATVLLENLDKWLLRVLLNKDIDIGGACKHVVSLLVPHEVFKTLIDFPNHEQSRMFNKIHMEPRDPDDEMIERANHILDFLTGDFEMLSGLLKDDKSVNPRGYTDLVGKLATITGRDVCEFLLKVADVLMCIDPIGAGVRDIVEYILPKQPNLITTEFIVRCLPDEPKPGDMIFGHRLLTFYDSISAMIETFNPPEAIVMNFLKYIAFAVKPLVGRFAVIEKYVRRFAMLYPDLLRTYLKDDFEAIVKKHYSTLLLTLEVLGDKMAVLEHLPQATGSTQHFPINELVQKAFALNDGDVTAVIPIVALLNTPELEDSTRDLIWSVVLDKVPSLSEFLSSYSWRGDWVNLTKYMLKLNDHTDPRIAEHLLECAQNSIAALELSFDWLKEHAKEALLAPTFAAVVFTLDIGEHTEVMEKFILLAIEGKNEEQIRDLLLPMTSKILMRVKFLNEVLEDVADDGVTKDDIVPLFGPLTVFGDIQIGTSVIVQDLGRLKYNLQREDVAPRLHLAESQDLIARIRKVILI